MSARVHEVVYAFRLPSSADAHAVHTSLDVERGDKIPNVAAAVSRDPDDDAVLRVVLSSGNLGDLRAATKSFFTRIRAAAGVLEEASARDEK